ncbi:hypothetical protein RclHR1_00180005 [Rhizophagus clarus]|uniref:Uncharacterized protein n=1 Tax=Rhizophagus clarus TaxID=94130 RepID=A0A2Z6QL22_9GLOM|nr:hypothetical protein RclHR1_00180005 [Rhizophagus clarus]GES73030.1 hypothetical protein GLOIN_2v1470680 [Rhizophagus clarus]
MNCDKKRSKKKSKVQAEYDEFFSQTRKEIQFNDSEYEFAFKRELTKTEYELSEKVVEFNQLKDELEGKVRKLEGELSNERQRFDDLIEESKKGCERQLEEEKRKFNLEIKTLKEKTQKLEYELSKEIGENKKGHERQLEKKKQESNSELKTLEKVRRLEYELSKEKQKFHDSKKKYDEQLEREKREKRNFDSKSKNLEAKVNELKGKLSKEKQNIQNSRETIKREYEKQLEREKQVFDSRLKDLEEMAKFHQQNFNQLKKNYDELQLAKKDTETNMKNNITNLDQQMRVQEKNFRLQFDQANKKYKENINSMKQKLNEKGNGLRELEENNLKLKEEASKYQSALGVATNICLGDGDQNHSVKLKQDILKLQKTLENYVTHLKPNIKINIEQAQKLAQEYGCLNEITAKNPNKLFIRAVLQRKVLDLVCEFSRDFVKFQGRTSKFESDIDSKARELLSLIKLFSITRVGTDEVIDASIVKIRQQIYGILGNRGFNNIIDDDGNTRMHDFIVYASNKLNNIMNQYREINDINRKEQVDAMAPKLIQDIYKLFWFRVNVQEPKIKIEYFESSSIIDPDTMKGMWNDDEIDKLRVDICCFPMVGRDFDSSDVRIYAPAKVFPRNISVSNETNVEAYE